MFSDHSGKGLEVQLFQASSLSARGTPNSFAIKYQEGNTWTHWHIPINHLRFESLGSGIKHGRVKILDCLRGDERRKREKRKFWPQSEWPQEGKMEDRKSICNTDFLIFRDFSCCYKEASNKFEKMNSDKCNS